MRHSSLKENAYQIIKEKILNGEFEKGERIREDLLAEEIEMSRTPVREAINQLAAEGMVNNIPRRGIYLVEFTKEQLMDMLEVREALEKLAIEKAIINIEDKEVKELYEMLDDFKKTMEIKDYKECNIKDSLFHIKIARIANNQKLISYLEEIEGFMKIARSYEKQDEPEEKNFITLNEHIAIVEAIKNKDSLKAKEAIGENIRRMKLNLGFE